MKKEKVIVFIVNKTYLFALGTMLVNLRSVAPDDYDAVIIYYEGLSNSDKLNLQKIEPKANFIEYSYNKWCFEHREPKSKLSKNFINRYSHLALIKYKVMEQLRFYRRVLYLDLDMLVKGGIRELFSIEKPAWRNGMGFTVKIGRFYKGTSSDFKDVPKSIRAPNAGLLYFTDTFNYEQCLLDAKDFVCKYLDDFSNNLDEITISWILYKNNVDVEFLDREVFNVLLSNIKENSQIIHFMGGTKPWSSSLSSIIFPEWSIYHELYLKHTGETVDALRYDKNYTTLGVIYCAVWSKVLTATDFSLPAELKSNFDFTKSKYLLSYTKKINYELSIDLQKLNMIKIGLRVNSLEVLQSSRFSHAVEQLKNDVEGLFTQVGKNDLFIAVNVSNKNFNKEFQFFFSKTFGSIVKIASEYEEKNKESLNNFKMAFDTIFSARKEFVKAWIYQNKVLALDFLVEDKKIAFDILIDEKKEMMHCWIFCRNKPEFIKKYEDGFLELKNNKGLVFSSSTGEIKACSMVINKFLENSDIGA